MAKIYLHPSACTSPDAIRAVEISTQRDAVADDRSRVVLVSRQSRVEMPIIVMNARKEWCRDTP